MPAGFYNRTGFENKSGIKRVASELTRPRLSVVARPQPGKTAGDCVLVGIIRWRKCEPETQGFAACPATSQSCSAARSFRARAWRPSQSSAKPEQHKF